MKIVCGSCQAKYSIADEKVAGKVFKIRCKRCSEVIVVRGDQDTHAEAGNGMDAGSNGGYPGNGSYDPSSVDAIWHVVVNGEQAGPYTPHQLSDMMSNGQLDWEAYVWSEGFENWVPMRDVPDLVTAISGQPAEEPAAVAAVAAPMRAAAQPSMGADPFADEGGGAVGMFAQPAAQARARSNLFEPSGAGFDTSPKVVASAPSPRVSADQAMTGVRNENSVLFSLKNLQALATGTSTPAPSAPGGPSHRPGFAAGEGSGLIDIRALASATGVGDQGRGETEKDALLSLGSAQTGAFGALGSPMLAPSKADEDGSKKGLAIAIIGGFALLAGAAIAIAVILKPGVSTQPPVVAPMVMPPIAAPGAAVAATAPNDATRSAAEPPSEGELAARNKQNAAPAAASGEDRRHGGSAPKHASAAPAEKPAAVAAPVEPVKPADKPKARGGSSIDDLLEGAIGSGAKGGKHEAAAPAANLPDKPSREDVIDAMNGVKDAVKACAKGAGGVAFANITVVGKTGRVGNVEITGITGEVGSCIARTVRNAKFSKFKSDNFQVKFPFRL